MFKKRMIEAYLTNDPIVFGMIQSELKKKDIKFQTKCNNIGTQNRSRGIILGNLGEDINLEIMYYIYSNKEDVEKVKNIAYEIIRQVSSP